MGSRLYTVHVRPDVLLRQTNRKHYLRFSETWLTPDTLDTGQHCVPSGLTFVKGGEY